MKKIISILAAAGMAVSLLAGCGGSAPAAQSGSAAGSAAELTLIVASNQTDPTNPYNYGLDKFKEVAEEVSGGKISVTVH